MGVLSGGRVHKFRLHNEPADEALVVHLGSFHGVYCGQGGDRSGGGGAMSPRAHAVRSEMLRRSTLGHVLSSVHERTKGRSLQRGYPNGCTLGPKPLLFASRNHRAEVQDPLRAQGRCSDSMYGWYRHVLCRHQPGHSVGVTLN